MTEQLNWVWNFPSHWIPSQKEIDTSPAWVTMLECRLGMNFKVGDYSVAHSGIILRLLCKYNIQPFYMGILMSALELNWRLLPMDDSLKSPTCFFTWAKVASSRAHGSWSFCHKCKMYSYGWFAVKTLKRLSLISTPPLFFPLLIDPMDLNSSYGFK